MDTAASSKRVSVVFGLLGSLTVVAALIGYKASASFAAYAKARASGTMAPKTPLFHSAELPAALRPFADAANYLSWVLIALAFGLVLGAAVKSLLPKSVLMRSVGAGGLRAQLAAAAIGAPLMLCSCCSAPVFEGVYQRSRRLGPALAMMIASPALNPAALALTFLLFPRRIAFARLLGALALVLVAGAIAERSAPSSRTAAADCALDRPDGDVRAVMRDFLSALREAFLRTLPTILVGVLLSALIAGLVPLRSLSGVPGGAAIALAVAAAVAVPIAMPTFAEIPIGLALLAAGAPQAAVIAVLIAGPAINLPSLLTVGRTVSPKVALGTGFAVFAVACLSGIAAGGL